MLLERLYIKSCLLLNKFAVPRVYAWLLLMNLRDSECVCVHVILSRDHRK